ncbi:tRNA (guanine(46)-N(7))-methyltransferase TrmB [Roseospirillum parvum]|uniref:tRNA (guanine-N(7)-)-methyltransferase n=1 Tax=Roseospirillum parvum TaxID=83401 RepID=A0A1G8DM01_9PROT|nr:tRNA (guanine(46)-N(7))-methyltransferase TrmB [Roseospirillum parvum]SDH58509.1 tRNA (guanine-N7-)-methyltransferase [Roseospirillum parvum]
MARRVDEGRLVRDPLLALAAEPDDGRDGRFHGRRRGKHLKPGRQRALEVVLPRLSFQVPEAGGLDPWALFDARPAALWLEIGFGGGEHLAAQAEANPGVGLIGCEPFLNGLGSLCALIEDKGLGNVRLLPDDARPLLAALPEGCLERVFVLFPDPWPKTRHAKRRLISPRTLSALARITAPGGELRVFSDDPTYVRWALRHGTEHAEWQWTARVPGDWRAPPADHARTRYEEKALAEGRVPRYLVFRRRPEPAAP